MDIEEFVKSRWKNQLVSQGYPSDIIDAVLVTSSSLDLQDAFERIKALKNFKMSPAFDALAVAFKRVVNILKGSQEFTLNPDLFDTEGERNLFNAYEERGEEIEKLLAKKDYEHALEKLSLLKVPVDAFFDDVMVMVEDEAIRNNRLALLQSIGKMLYKICDFLKIATN
jgi:glycyl-tRNA synthetase beta chain